MKLWASILNDHFPYEDVQLLIPVGRMCLRVCVIWAGCWELELGSKPEMTELMS